MLRLLRLFSGLLIPDGGLRRLHPLPRLSRLSSFSATSANGLVVSHLHQARSLAAMVAIVAFLLSAFCRPRFCKGRKPKAKIRALGPRLWQGGREGQLLRGVLSVRLPQGSFLGSWLQHMSHMAPTMQLFTVVLGYLSAKEDEFAAAPLQGLHVLSAQEEAVCVC